MFLLLLSLIPSDTLLVSVRFESVDSAIVVEAMEQDSTLWLPSADIGKLLGVTIPSEWISTDGLRARYRLTVDWIPQQLLVVIRDPYEVLPASRGRSQRIYIQQPTLAARTGFFGSFIGNDNAQSASQLGYSWKGRVVLSGQHSSLTGNSWNGYAAPFRGLWLSASHFNTSTNIGVNISRRWLWFSASHSSFNSTYAAAAVTLFRSRLVVFGNSLQQFVVTYHKPIDIQLGYNKGHLVGKVGFGPTPLSPFGLPFIP